jgi:prolipoprotein diacylglyceryltransferase
VNVEEVVEAPPDRESQSESDDDTAGETEAELPAVWYAVPTWRLWLFSLVGGAVCWGVRFPFYDQVTDGPFRHPSQLYEAALGVMVVCCAWAADRHWGREQRPRGIMTGITLSVYFAGRILVELAKEPQPSETLTGPLNMGQLLSVPLLAAGLFVTWHSLRLRARAGWR